MKTDVQHADVARLQAEADKQPRWRAGDKALKFTTTAREKFDHSNRWLWGKLKTPDFPQPIYIEGSPHFIEREVDEYLARCVVDKRERKTPQEKRAA